MKKRLLALVLCCAVVIGLVPAMVTAAYTDGTRLIVTCNGDSSDSVVLQQGETADLTAIYEDFMEEGDTLQWQKSQEGDWVNIPGETGEHLYVTSDMLDGQTGFRCTITGPEGNVTESNCVYVELAAQDEVPQDESGTLFEDTSIELEEEDTAIELEDGEAAEPAEDGEIVSDEPENSENSESSEEETTEDVAPEVETCEECGLSNGEHSEDCSHYVPECTCGAEEGDVHDIDCPLYEEEFDVDYYYELLMDCETSDEMDEIAEEVDEENWQLFSDEMKDDLLTHYIEVSPGQPILPVYENNSRPFTSAGPVIQYDSPSLLSAYSVSALSLYDDEVSVLSDGEDDEEQQTDGLKLDKTATVDNNGNITITLEAYATGESVTTYVKDGVDIVLMLDLSSYMNTTTTSTVYNEVDGSTTYETLYNLYNSGQTYFVHYNGTYQQVKVVRNWVSTGFWEGYYQYSVALASNSDVLISKKNGSDTIGSASYELYTQQTTTTSSTAKLEALKTAVTTFITKVHNEAPASRIAIVTYANNAEVKSGSKLADKEALVTVDDAGLTALTNIVDGLSVLGGNSNSHYAVADAVKIFQDVPTDSAEYSRQRVALLFSAGVPGNGWETNDQKTGGKDIAQATMHLSNILKTAKGSDAVLPDSNFAGGEYWSDSEIQSLLNDTSSSWNDGCGATFYCVGLDIPTSGDPANVYMGESPYIEGAMSNEYFWRISSHRPDGSHIDSPADFGSEGMSVYDGRKREGVDYYGKSYYYFYPDSLTRNQTDGYYLTTNSNDQSGLSQLNTIFASIAGEAVTDSSSSTTLGTSTVVKDIVAPQFQLPANATANDISIYTYAFTGKNGEIYNFGNQNEGAHGAKATVSADGQVSVTGFDFASNWCGTSTDVSGTSTNHGYKLVISFTVVQKDGFLGGNDVYTNGSAGVYENADATEAVQSFPKPTVNVPIENVTVTAADKNVYLLGSLTAEQIKSGATASCGNVSLNLGAENYGLESWQYEYVDITVTYTDASGNNITNLSELKDDTTYTVTVTVSPKTDGSTTDQGKVATEQEGNGTGKINIFKPELTFKDSEVYYGDTAPTSYDGNKTGEVWKHGDTVSTDTGVTMIGDKPTLSLTYTPETGKIVNNKIATKVDISVDVAVKIGTTGVTDKTTFVHTRCDTSETDPTGGKFWLHVKTCQLTITKTGGASDESYVFDVYKDGVKYTEITVWGNGSETIYELPVGTYSIVENTGWSWRYTPSYSDNVALSSANTSGTITCTNTSMTNQWLNGFSTIVKNIFGVKH